jgi:hypothetical protein
MPGGQTGTNTENTGKQYRKSEMAEVMVDNHSYTGSSCSHVAIGPHLIKKN